MKVVHLCLGGPYTDGYGYQENLLPKAMQRQNTENTIITLMSSYDHKFDNFVSPVEYINTFGCKIIRLPKNKGHIKNFFMFYDVYDILLIEQPDMIFVHGIQTLSALQAVKYKKKVNSDCILVCDNHADYYNSPLKKDIIHRLFYYIRKLAVKYCVKYYSHIYGVTPWRCEYLTDYYDIPPERIELLVMGADDEMIDFKRRNEIRKKIREKHKINENDFLIISGGKIDSKKNIHLLAEAVNEINNDRVKLIAFGNPNQAMSYLLNDYQDNERIKFIGSIPAEETYHYFLASDLIAFPGTHSVMWEQAVACKTPCLFKEWEGMKHVDIGGNCLFLKNDSENEIRETLNKIINDKDFYLKMKEAAQSDKADVFLYSNIAKRLIEDDICQVLSL